MERYSSKSVTSPIHPPAHSQIGKGVPMLGKEELGWLSDLAGGVESVELELSRKPFYMSAL